MNSTPNADKRRQVSAEVEEFLRRGGAVQTIAPGTRRNPLNEDRHNTFLFLGRKR